MVTAACAAAFTSMTTAAAAESPSRRAVRPGTGVVSEWAYFNPARGTTSLNMELDRIVSLSRAWRREGGELLWFRSGGQGYLVRDPEILARARAVLQDQRDLDPEIEAAERRSKSIEAREERLDREEERLEEQLERIENERDAIHDRRSSNRGGDFRERDRQRLSELRRAADAIRERMEALSPRRKAIDDELAVVSRQEQVLDRRQQALEARSDAAMLRLCREVLAAGRAQPFTP